MKRRFETRWLALAASLVLALGGAAGAGPERSADAAAIGAENHPKLLARFGGEIPDEALINYVATIGARIVAVSEQPDEDWQFTVLDSPSVNAFALPGGYVYITRGLLALAGDEAELAAVLGHEIVHVTAAHVEARLAVQAEDNSGELVGDLLGGLLGGLISGSESPLADAVRNTVESAVGGQMEFSREQEFEADALSIPILVAAGYDPYAAADFLVAMRAQYALVARLEGRGFNPSQVPFFADHPAPDERIARARDLAESMAYIQPPVRGTEPYLAAIDGMIFGDSPAQGMVRGRAFIHSELGFSFLVPEGFTLQNTAQAVRARGPDGAMLIMEGGRDRGGDLRRFIADEWAPALRQTGQARPRLSRVRSTEINGLEAAQARLTRRFRGRNQEMTLTAIRLNGTIYRFTALSARGADTAQGAMAEAVASFAALPVDAGAALAPYILTAHQLRAQDSVASLTADAPAESAAADWFAVLNGLEPGELPPVGSWVKVIRY
ncbi:M48 family metalloprotease [Abyssibius alkaniclasticus]|uniref:M48 family metalloprotease n=1 Tax=Abyssibius alkaniclasticus TaxID=2881234 RepID=UPI0023632AD0|nr:M48 family metalloprotease [Abyssibius alkaniclasticus]UPH71683.1 M48 family metalloprotease [Abyssibius alkaniclasticus]